MKPDSDATLHADEVLSLQARDIAGLGGGDREKQIDAVRRGLPIDGLDRLLKAGRLTLDEIDKVVLPRRAIASRRRLGRLNPGESDRLVRVVNVITAAEATFGSVEKAARWLRRPTVVFDGEAPIERLDTHDGVRDVEHLLGRIDHGLAA